MNTPTACYECGIVIDVEDAVMEDMQWFCSEDCAKAYLRETKKLIEKFTKTKDTHEPKKD